MKIYASVIIVIIVSIVIFAIVIIFALLIIVIFTTITIIVVVVVVVVTIDFFLRTSIHERPKLQQNRLKLLLFCTFFTDINECDPDNPRHRCSQICENTPGSYNCSCEKGFELNKDGYECEGMWHLNLFHFLGSCISNSYLRSNKAMLILSAANHFREILF